MLPHVLGGPINMGRTPTWSTCSRCWHHVSWPITSHPALDLIARQLPEGFQRVTHPRLPLGYFTPRLYRSDLTHRSFHLVDQSPGNNVFATTAPNRQELLHPTESPDQPAAVPMLLTVRRVQRPLCFQSDNFCQSVLEKADPEDDT